MMSSCHEWIVDAGSLSFYGKMMKNEMEKEAMPKDTLLASKKR